MKTKPIGGDHILVCDVGGVVLADGMKSVLAEISREHDCATGSVEAIFRTGNLRDRLWRGEVTTEAFWASLGEALNIRLDLPERLDRRVVAACHALPSIDVLNETMENVWLATNHREEWVQPALEASGLRNFRDRVICSSTVGQCKPDRTFFDAVVRAVQPPPDVRVSYCDDQASNLVVPSELGWTTVLVGSHPADDLQRLIDQRRDI